MTLREPVLQPVRITELRPTQMTVGLREVEDKRRVWRERDGGEAQDFLGRHMIPVIKGPKNRLYVIDHHHLVRALHDEGQAKVLVNVIADISSLTQASFWTVCEHRNWVHPYDSKGRRCATDAIPKKIGDLVDDPYRSGRGVTPLWRLRQGHDALFRVPLGRFPQAAPHPPAGRCRF